MGQGKSFSFEKMNSKMKAGVCAKWKGNKQWVRKEKWVACRLPACAYRRKKAEQETDALNYKWPPQGKKRWVGLFFLDCKRKNNSSLSARSLISRRGGGEGVREEREGKKDLFLSLSFSSHSSFLLCLPLAVSANDIIKLSSYLTVPTSQCLEGWILSFAPEVNALERIMGAE